MQPIGNYKEQIQYNTLHIQRQSKPVKKQNKKNDIANWHIKQKKWKEEGTEQFSSSKDFQLSDITCALNC